MATSAAVPAGDGLDDLARVQSEEELNDYGAEDDEVEEEVGQNSESEAGGEEDADGMADDEVDEEDEEDEAEEEGEESGHDTGSASGLEEASEEEAEGSHDEHEAVGAVKLPKGMELNTDEEAASEDSSDASESGDDADADRAAAESEASSSAAEEWEDASAGEADVEAAARNSCFFCKQSEEEDPSEDFEEYLTCVRCGDNAHQQCAREDDFLQDGEDIRAWHCPDCAARDDESTAADEVKHRRQSTASQVPKDLLPAPRARVKPGAHSIFNDLIIDEDPLDGSRPLRKRKASSEAIDTSSVASSKRRREARESQSASEAAVSRPTSSHHARGRRDSTNKGNELAEGGRTNESSPNKLGRPRRQKLEANRARLVEKAGKKKLVMAFKVDLTQIKHSKAPKKYKRSLAMPILHSRISNLPATQYTSPFYSLQGNEVDETKNKPYGGILTESQADTSKTFPASEDRAKFDDARRRYEEEWKIKSAALEAENELKNRASTKISGPPSKIKCINFGGFEIDTWYAAPYPEEYSRNRVLFICEFCLKYMPSDYVAWRHKLKCPTKHPPGDEIYRDGSISVFEVDGRKNPVYCQNLCLLAKLFLGSKTLYYDVEPFLFYIMTENDDFGYHFVGYFSKEKRPSSMNNVSCILTLPIHQRKGYGNLLIDFSYLLTRVEQKTGSPEKPLSDMGLVSYRNYWRLVLARTLLDQRDPISISRISDLTGMTPDDIIAGLEALRSLVRDPVTKSYALRIDRSFMNETIEHWETKKYVTLNADALIWTPYIMGRNNLASYDRGAPISTVAPRDDEDEEESNELQPEEDVQLALQQEARANAESPPPAGVNGSLEIEMSTTLAQAEASVDAPPAAVPGNDEQAAEAAASPKVNGAHPNESSEYSAATQNGTAGAPAPTIPPTRYEIYPPIPGTAVRRKYFRPTPRKSLASPGGLPVRRGRPPNSVRLAAATPGAAEVPKTNGSGLNGGSPAGSMTPNGRKTRSKATEEHRPASSAADGGSGAEESGALAKGSSGDVGTGAEGGANEQGDEATVTEAAFSLNQDIGASEGEDDMDTPEIEGTKVNGVEDTRDASMIDA